MRRKFSEQGKHYIGEEYQGGIVFHLDPDGRSGLVMSSLRNLAQASWYDAIDIAKSYNGEGYADWYLPSRRQLDLLYQQRDEIGGFTELPYWTFEEYNSLDGWAQSLITGYEFFTSKDNLLMVLPIREFKDRDIEGRRLRRKGGISKMRKYSQGYQGWSNYETWVVNLWFGNDAGLSGMIDDMAEEANGEVNELADMMKEFVEENNPLSEAGMYVDLLNSSLWEVNYREIAEHWLDSMK